MFFNSFEFLIFLPVVFFLYWFIFNKNLTSQNILLLIASYFFYGWWSWKFLILLALSTMLDFLYGFGVASANKGKSRFFLWLSIINNLGILGVFKYYNFFATEFARGFGALGLHVNPVLLNIALPVGISFYTFHGMSYVFDIYKGVRKPATNFVEYAVFVSFFPLLVAGPIERANHLLPQIQVKRVFNYDQAADGAKLILWGLFKKVVISDTLATYVDIIFSHNGAYSGSTNLLGAIFFAFQIYCDFSGYSDIAMGVAKQFGFELFRNFNYPYFSRDIAEFWRRWHISLSSWFRDYLYIPMGGSRVGRARRVLNTFIIFIVSGFWHGASWTYIVWGGLNALYITPLVWSSKNRTNMDTVATGRTFPTIRELLMMGITFILSVFAWIFFRAKTVGIAWSFLKRIFSKSLFAVPYFPGIGRTTAVYFLIVFLLLMDWNGRFDNHPLEKIGLKTKPYVRWTFYMIMIMMIFSYSNLNQVQQFIYFQF